MQEAQFMRYERISDTLYSIGNGLVLRMNVSLAFYDKNHNRRFFYNEYQYPKENRDVVTIRRNYDYYLTIDNTRQDGMGIMITIREFIKFKEAIKEAVSWFRDRRWNRLYAKGNGKLVLVSPIPEVRASGFPGGKQISIDPIIIDGGRAIDDKFPGVRFSIAPNNYADITVDTLIGLDYIVDSINMIQLAQTMIASIPVPDINALRVSFSREENTSERRERLIESTQSNTDEKVGKTIIGRKIGGSNGVLQ